MVVIKTWNDKPIDMSSKTVKDKILQSVSDYIINHWDECVQISATNSSQNYEVEFSITL